MEVSKQTGLPLVAAGDVHYHSPARQPLWEVLTATRLGTTVDRLAEHRFANAQRHLRPREEIAALFAAAARGTGAHAGNRRALHFLARRAAVRISRGTGAAGFTPMRVSDSPGVERGAQALSERHAGQGAPA